MASKAKGQSLGGASFAPAGLMPWIEAVANQQCGIHNTFLHIQDHTVPFAGGLNVPLRKKLASCGDLTQFIRDQEEDEDSDAGEEEDDFEAPAPAGQPSLKRSASWPLLGPSSEEVFMNSMVTKMFYKPSPIDSSPKSLPPAADVEDDLKPKGRHLSEESTDTDTGSDGHYDSGSNSGYDSWASTPEHTPVIVKEQPQKPSKEKPSKEKALPGGLPSIGSAGHFDGTCRPCCFKLRQRCSVGARCKHCHFDHDRIQRPGKKTRDRMRRQKQGAAGKLDEEEEEVDQAEMDEAATPSPTTIGSSNKGDGDVWSMIRL